MMYKTVKITQRQRDIAKKLYPFTALRGSVTQGESNIYGALGEVVVREYYEAKGVEVTHDNTYDYDLMIGGYKVDVKSKKTNYEPQPHFFSSIPSYNTKQQCDLYLFVMVREDLSEAYLLGYKKKNAFYNEATFNKKGEKDWNGWLFKTDCYNLRVDKLNPLK